nr:class I SAM-dependent methyltransferase [Neoroseomonas terrae]
MVDQIQADAGIAGHGAEIGVFHGKFFIALASLLPPDGKMTALDVFDDQSKNIDGAGEGSLEKIKSNVAAYGRCDIDHVYIATDSTALTALDRVNLVRDRGPFRLFSVDGCHTVEHTLSDLRTAEDCLSSGGVIILDDFMHPHWPGVTQAASLFCAGVPRVAPFLYAHHKLFMVGVGWHAHFVDACRNTLAHHDSMKMTTMFHSKVVSIYP